MDSREHFEYLLQRRIWLTDKIEKIEKSLVETELLPRPLTEE